VWWREDKGIEDVAAEAITQVQHYEADKTAGDRVEQVGQKILNVHLCFLPGA